MKDLQIIEWKRAFDDSDKKIENIFINNHLIGSRIGMK